MDEWGNEVPDQAPGERVFGTPTPNPSAEGTIIEGTSTGPSLPVALVTRRSRRGVWAAALSFVLVIAIATTVGAFFMVSRSGSVTSETSSYVPQNAVYFMAGRLDLPGDQHDKVAAFLSHFPGGRDQASFDSKFDKTLDEILGWMTTNRYTWTGDFKDWVGDEMSVALLSFDGMFPNYGAMAMMPPVAGESPSTYAGSGGMTLASNPAPSVMIASVKDQAKAEAWVKAQVAKARFTLSTETYAGTTLYYQQSGFAYAFGDKVLVLGTTEGVKAALDAPTKGSIEKNSRYQAAAGSLKGDRIGWFYIDMQAFVSAYVGSMMGSLLDPAGSPLPGSCLPPGYLSQITSMYDWVAGSFRADDNYLALEVTSPKPKGTAASVTPSNHASDLAAHLPKSAWAALELHSVGAIAGNVLKTYSDPSLPATCRQSTQPLLQAVAAIGGVEWIGDVAASVAGSGQAARGGLVIKATDRTKASNAMASWQTALALAGAGMRVGKDTYNGVEITFATLDSSTQFAYAQRDDLVFIGYGEDYVKAMLDATSSNSLAAVDRYRAALDAAGTNNGGWLYVDIPTLAQQYVATLFGPSLTQYSCGAKPYVDQLDAVAVTGTSGDINTARIVLTAHGTPGAPAPCN